MAWEQNAQTHQTSQKLYPMVIVDSGGHRDVARPTQSHPVPATTPPFHPSGPQNQQLQWSQASPAQQSHVVTPAQPVDYRLLLLSLTDQYISAARRTGALIAYNRDEADIESYYEYTSAGLRCLDACLYHRKLPPREEAFLQLRRASLLFEETMNYGTIEQSLTKSIAFCDRHRFSDLKYSMYHLLARVLSKTNIRAALKHLDNVLSECTTLGLVPWIYAFQFLRCSMVVQLQTTRDLQTALVGLRSVSELSRQRSDAEIAVTATLMQAAIHLRMHREDSSLEAQRALAAARAYLSNYAPKDLPQLYILVHELDLASSLDPYNHQQVATKAHGMQKLIDSALSGVKWQRDRTCVLRFNSVGFENILTETGGIFSQGDSNSGHGLMFSWLGRQEAYTLAVFLSALASIQRNGRGTHKSEQFLNDALKRTQDDFAFEDAPTSIPLAAACQQAHSRRYLQSLIHLYLVFAYSGRSEWNQARKHLDQYTLEASRTGDSHEELHVLAKYLEAVINQSTGNLDSALAIYQSQLRPLDTKDTGTLPPTKVIAILSVINSLLIVRPLSHPQHHLTSGLLERLKIYFPESRSQENPASALASQRDDLNSALGFAVTVCLQSNILPAEDDGATKAVASKGIVSPKKTLQIALSAAQKAGNPLLMSLCLSYMHDYFFTGIFSDQSTRLAQGAATQAGEAGSRLWVQMTGAKLRQMEDQQQQAGGVAAQR